MTTEEHNLAQEIIRLMKKYNKCGFVGTFCSAEPADFATFRIVMPGYADDFFKKIETGLVGLVNNETGGTSDRIESGYLKDPDFK